MADLALSSHEQLTLEQYETTIAQGLQTFIEVGHALLAIRDQRLYRARYTTFEAYCRERWGMQRTYAHRLIEAAKMTENLLPIGNILPANEAQARPLTSLSPDVQRGVWQRALETAPAGQVTAAHVQRVIEELAPPAADTQTDLERLDLAHDRAFALTNEALAEMESRLAAPDICPKELVEIVRVSSLFQQMWAEKNLRTQRILGQLIIELANSSPRP
jgi:hypothetical protein